LLFFPEKYEDSPEIMGRYFDPFKVLQDNKLGGHLLKIIKSLYTYYEFSMPAALK